MGLRWGSHLSRLHSIDLPISEAREGFHHFLDSSGLEGELTDMEVLAFEERFMEEMQVQHGATAKYLAL